MSHYRHGTKIHAKGYPQVTAGPLRGKLVHRIVAAAMIGRDLTKDEEVHHCDTVRTNCHHSNLIVMGHKDHGWVSAKQAWFMRNKDAAEKVEWDRFMADETAKFQADVRDAQGGGVSWQSRRQDGTLETEWNSRTTV
jgi:hypothetical protein